MTTLVTRDGTSIYYKDWGSGKPVLFSHGWPLDADMWDSQMEFWPAAATAPSPSTAVVSGVRASPGMATTTTPSPMTSPS